MSPPEEFQKPWCTDQVLGISLGLVSCAGSRFYTWTWTWIVQRQTKIALSCGFTLFRPEKGTIRIQHSEREASMASEGSWQSPRKCAFCGAHPIYQDPHLNFVWDTCHARSIGAYRTHYMVLYVLYIYMDIIYYLQAVVVRISSCASDYQNVSGWQVDGLRGSDDGYKRIASIGHRSHARCEAGLLFGSPSQRSNPGWVAMFTSQYDVTCVTSSTLFGADLTYTKWY